MNENKDLLQYLYRKNTIQTVDNVIVATNVFLFRRVCLDMAKEGGNSERYESLTDFLEQVDPVQVIIDVNKKSLDKSQSSAYTNESVVQAPTAVPVPPHPPRMSVPVHNKSDDLLDRWMIKE